MTDAGTTARSGAGTPGEAVWSRCLGSGLRPPTLIDAWVQPWTAEVAENIPARALHVLKQYGRASRPEQGVSLEVMMEEVESAGIDLAPISAGPLVPMHLVCEALDRWPDRLVGVAWTDPTSTSIMKAVGDLERLVRDYPICGFKLESFILWRAPTDRIFYPLYAKCAELGLTLQVQVGGSGPLYPSSSGRPLLIDEVALDFPELQIVCGHIGSPWVDEMIHVAWKHPNVYIDTSARLPKYFERQFVQFLRTYGQDKCLFATDWPVLGCSRAVDEVDALDLEAPVRRKFLVDNASVHSASSLLHGNERNG